MTRLVALLIGVFNLLLALALGIGVIWLGVAWLDSWWTLVITIPIALSILASWGRWFETHWS